MAELLLAGATEATESPEWETITAGPNAAKIGFRKRHEALVAYAGRLRKLGLDYAEVAAGVPAAVGVVRTAHRADPRGEVSRHPAELDCNYPVTWPEAQASCATYSTATKPE